MRGNYIKPYMSQALIRNGRFSLLLQRALYFSDPDAQYELGVIYERGLGVSYDPEEALSWYKKAALQSHPLATLHLELFMA